MHIAQNSRTLEKSVTVVYSVQNRSSFHWSWELTWTKGIQKSGSRATKYIACISSLFCTHCNWNRLQAREGNLLKSRTVAGAQVTTPMVVRWEQYALLYSYNLSWSWIRNDGFFVTFPMRRIGVVAEIGLYYRIVTAWDVQVVKMHLISRSERAFQITGPVVYLFLCLGIWCFWY